MGIEVEYSYCEKNDPNCKYRKPNIGMIDSLTYKNRLTLKKIVYLG